MKRHTKRTIILSAVLLLGFFLVTAAAAVPGLKPPKSFRFEVMDMSKVYQIDMPLDPMCIPMEEKDSVGPTRVAVPMYLDLDITEAGTWETLPKGGMIWRLRVNSHNAHFLSFIFSDFELPEGAELYFISVYRDFHVGPFTHLHNKPDRLFGSPVIAGDAAVIELYLPPGTCTAALTLESVSHGYKNALGMGGFPYRDTDAARERAQLLQQPIARVQADYSCQRDINCPEGAPYQDLKRAVAEGYDGAYVCSGQLINNVRQDNRYLYITAAHCGWWKRPSVMSYYWNYENTGCGTNDYPPWTYSTGSTNLYRSKGGTSKDVNLLELHGTDLEGTYNIYFMGWNRGDTAPTSAAMISHPADKPKQIVIRYDPVIDCAIGSCPNGWGDNFWRVTSWDVGVDQAGSSGGGLLDQNNLLVGTLTGGVGTDCLNFAWDEFYKLSAEWSKLRPFLDPDNTGAITLPGKDWQ